MNFVKKLGCLASIFLFGLGLLFAKFLVPIVPIIIAIVVYFSIKQIKSTIFSPSINLYEIVEGRIKLEGKAISHEEDILSPYFNQECIGYFYKEEEHIPNDNGYYAQVRVEKMECKNFSLRTSTSTINVNAHQLNLSNLAPKTKSVHSLKPNVNDIAHIEHTLKNNDDVVIFGNVMRNNYGKFEISKLKKEPFFATTKSKVEATKISFKLFLQLLPWLCLLYIAVNYFLFFAPSKNIQPNYFFPYVIMFGLPIAFIIFGYIGKDKTDRFSSLFQFLATACILISFLSIPLIVLFYFIELEYYRMLYIFISIVVITTFMLIFNYKKLSEFKQ